MTTYKVLTANDLLSGAVVYLDRDGRWQPDLSRARRFDPQEQEACAALGRVAEANTRLIGVACEELIREAEGERFVRLRAHIRARGPTTAYGQQVSKTRNGGVNVSV